MLMAKLKGRRPERQRESESSANYFTISTVVLEITQHCFGHSYKPTQVQGKEAVTPTSQLRSIIVTL